MLFSHKYRYFFILILGVYSYFNTLLTDIFEYYPIQIPFFYLVLHFICISFIVWEGNRVLQLLLSKFFLTKRIRFLIILFLCSLPVAFFAGLFSTLFLGKVFLGYSIQELFLPLKLSLVFSFRLSLFLHCLNTIFFFFKKYEQSRFQAEELRRLTIQAELQSLRHQVNPHFLFNSLNVLSSLILQDTNAANEFVEQFAKVYRYVLKSQEKELVSLQEELEFIEAYLFLLKKRFGESISVDISIATQDLTYFVVPVALQMLLENAIKHNIVSQKTPLKIWITSKQEGQVSIKNSLQRRKYKEETSTRLGLQNIGKHYQLLTQKSIFITESEHFFEVLLPLIQMNYESTDS